MKSTPEISDEQEAAIFLKYYNQLKNNGNNSTKLTSPCEREEQKQKIKENDANLVGCSSFKSIPSFYQKLPKNSDNLALKLREEARTLFLQKRSKELLDNNELKILWGLLENNCSSYNNQQVLQQQHQAAAVASTLSSSSSSSPIANNNGGGGGTSGVVVDQLINYDEYLKVLQLAGTKSSFYLTAKLFARLQAVSGYPGRVSITSLFNYTMRKVWLQQTRIGLSLYDYTGQGYLRESDLEAYIMELIPTLPQLEGLERSFHSFYVCTAVRKFFFFLDPLGTGKIRIRDILACSFLDDLLELRDDETPKDSQEINWFSAPSALSVYGHYLNLDKDHNGMLSKSELAGYGSGTLTTVFLDRVFSECHTYNGEMDYKTYLDFVLALENRHEPQSLRYLFRILDFEHCGYLTGFSLNYFFKGIDEQIIAHRAEKVNFEDVKDEIFDMIKPKDSLKITLKDLIVSGQGETMVSILIEFHKFWAYENRETMVVESRVDEQQQQQQPTQEHQEELLEQQTSSSVSTTLPLQELHLTEEHKNASI